MATPPRRGPAARGAAAGRTDRDQRRRTLSQNFLHDQAAAARFVAAAGLEPGDLVLEVGAGSGALTTLLAERSGRVVAYEVDPHYASRLTPRLRGDDRVTVVRGDFRRATPPDEPFAVVGNVPFSVTSGVVDWCLAAPYLTSATFITQLEYARKRTGDFGRWSLRTVETWPWVEWRLCGTIPRTAFRPVPGVDAGILRLTRRAEPLVDDALRARWEWLVRLGFGGVGGTLYASFARELPARRVAAAFATARVARDTVVAFVPPDAWIALFRELEPVL